MTFKEVADMVKEVGIPTAYYEFEETQQGPPYLCFWYDSNNDLVADDSNYQKIVNLIVELYTDKKDLDLEAAVEGVLASHGLVYSRTETRLGDEQMTEVVYQTNIVITEESNG